MKLDTPVDQYRPVPAGAYTAILQADGREMRKIFTVAVEE